MEDIYTYVACKKCGEDIRIFKEYAHLPMICTECSGNTPDYFDPLHDAIEE